MYHTPFAARHPAESWACQANVWVRRCFPKAAESDVMHLSVQLLPGNLALPCCTEQLCSKGLSQTDIKGWEGEKKGSERGSEGIGIKTRALCYGSAALCVSAVLKAEISRLEDRSWLKQLFTVMLCILINPLLFNGTLLSPNTVHHTAHIRNEPACTVCTVITSERKGWGWGGVRDFLHAHVEPLLLCNEK